MFVVFVDQGVSVIRYLSSTSLSRTPATSNYFTIHLTHDSILYRGCRRHMQLESVLPGCHFLWSSLWVDLDRLVVVQATATALAPRCRTCHLWQNGIWCLGESPGMKDSNDIVSPLAVQYCTTTALGQISHKTTTAHQTSEEQVLVSRSAVAQEWPWMDGWMEGWMDGQMLHLDMMSDRMTTFTQDYNSTPNKWRAGIVIKISSGTRVTMNGWMDKWMNGWMNGGMDGWPNASFRHDEWQDDDIYTRLQQHTKQVESRYCCQDQQWHKSDNEWMDG